MKKIRHKQQYTFRIDIPGSLTILNTYRYYIWCARNTDVHFPYLTTRGAWGLPYIHVVNIDQSRQSLTDPREITDLCYMSEVRVYQQLYDVLLELTEYEAVECMAPQGINI